MRFILGIAIGALVVYLMSGGEATRHVKSVVHDAANEVAKATEPSTKDRLGELVDKLSK
jgi:hypothetical protein